MRYVIGAVNDSETERMNAQILVNQGRESGARAATITLLLTTAIGATIGHFMAGSDGTVRGTIIGAAAGVLYQGARGRLS